MDKQKILYMTDHNTNTGFGIVGHNVCIALGTDYDVYFLGWGFHFESPIHRDNYTLLPSGGHPFAADVFPQYVMQLKPELFITQADTRMIDWLPNTLKQLPNKPTFILYPVIDGFVWDANSRCLKWPSDWTEIIKQADKVVAMSNFGKAILKENGVESETIYHGVDTSLFKPYPQVAKDDIKKNMGIPGRFVVGGVFKNIQRKNPEKYLQAFTLFRKGREDKVSLVLHTPPNRNTGGEFNLDQMAKDYGLVNGKDVFFIQQNLPTGQMPFVYNTMDVFWALGTMESFCLPLIEAMSCGVPVLATDTSTFPELLGDTGMFTDVPHYPSGKEMPVTFGSYNGVECPVPNPFDISRKTEVLLNNQKTREEMSMKETERAVKVFDWSIIKAQWVDLVKRNVVNIDSMPEAWRNIYESVK